MISNKPHLSVILPTYNGSAFIGRAIASVLRQHYADFELLVIDDGSTDDTAARVETIAASDRRVRLIRNEKNRGIQRTLNRGLQEAAGEYIARIDDDDEWIAADKLGRQVDFLRTHPDYLLVGTGVMVVDERGTQLFCYQNPETDAAIRSRMLSRNCFAHSSVLFRRDAALRLGGYDETERTRHVEDYDLWLRLGRSGKLANLPTYDLHFTLRSGAISGTHKLRQLQSQFSLMPLFKSDYPGYRKARVRSWLRMTAYALFGWMLTPSMRRVALRFSKL